MSLMSHFCDGCGHAFTDEHGLFFHNCIPAAMPPPECDQSVDVARLSGVQVGTSKLNESGIEGGGREPNLTGGGAALPDGVMVDAPTAEQLLDGAQFVQHRGGGIYRTCAEWDAAGVFVPLARWLALAKHLDGVPWTDGGQTNG